MKSATLALSIFAAIPYVLAHGFVSNVNIDGQAYTGNIPNANPSPSIVRQIDDVSPVKGASNPDVNCGHNGTVASLVANANPGSALTFRWSGGDLSHWPHNTGPMLTYMASCGSTPCNKFDSQTAQWFKIDQVGRQDNGSWVQQDLMNGGVANVSLPSNIAPGNYLIRHEIIALHLATSLGGAEFYPSCSQLTVGGTGTGAPTSSELVSLPGAYSDNDPGIFDPNVFDTNAPYTFPGPPVAAFVSSSTGAGASGSNSTTTASATATASTPSGTPSSGSGGSGSGSCYLKKKNSTQAVVRPRHVSRIMRDLYRARSH
jgi:hypothetical protein